MTAEADLSHLAPGLLADAVEAMMEGLAIFDPEQRLVACNRRYREMMAPIADMIVPGARWIDLVQAGLDVGMYSDGTFGDPAQVAIVREKLFRSGESIEFRQSDGRFYRASYRATRNGGFVLTRTDITELRRAEDMARDREALLTTILDTNPTPVIMARLSDSRILYRSPAATAVFGDRRHAVDYYVDGDERRSYVRALLAEGRVEDRRIRARAASGRTLTVSLSGGLTEYNGETCVVSSVTDLTEQLEREALIRRVVESCPAPVLMNRAATGEILYKSPELVALFGPADNARDFYVNPKDRAVFLSALGRSGEVTEHRSRFYNAAGEAIWAAVSARLISWEGEEVIVSHARDLSQQLAIEAELDRQREQVFQNEKMSALGSLLAGVAHELNNPLSVVVGHAMMLQDEAKDPSVLRQARKISEAAERCAKIVRTFLGMARQSPTRIEETNVNEIVATAVEVARYGNLGAIAIDLDLADEVLPVNGDADQLSQVVINLLINAEQAIEASGSGDTIQVTTRAGEGETLIVVEDNGPGVPADVRPRVFEPFFTTKGIGQGTGIGLAMCHRIVSEHGGTVALETVAPQGARFVVRLPSHAGVTHAAQAPEPEPPSDRRCRVLVIDDERDVADLNAEVLARGGFEAVAAYSAEEALDEMQRSPFDAVISDLNMPGIDGRGVFEAIRTEFAEMLDRTGFITGDTMGTASQEFLKESRRPFLEKPVSPRELRDFAARLAGREAEQ